jgi:hypothetical protein
MALVARVGLLVVVVLAVAALVITVGNMAATPRMQFESIESHCQGSWPNRNAIARIIRSAEPGNYYLKHGDPLPNSLSEPNGGVTVSFAPMAMNMPSGKGFHWYADGAAIRDRETMRTRGRFFFFRIMVPGATTGNFKAWPDYRWAEFYSSDSERICSLLPI